MSKILAITGATGKKSGGYFTHVICEHADEIRAMFDGGVRDIVRATSDTNAIDTVASEISIEEFVSEKKEIQRMSIHLYKAIKAQKRVPRMRDTDKLTNVGRKANG